jgi:hypothetical protein
VASENDRQEASASVAAGVVGYVVANAYLGGQLQAGFRQGVGELGAALKAFPDAIQVDEPGQAFNPLYRDMPGDPPSDRSGPEPATPKNPSPSQIAKETGSVYGEAKARGKDLPSPSQIAKQEPASRPDNAQGREHGQDRGGREM